MKKDRWLFLVCLLMATCIWLMYHLSQSYVSVMSVPVIAMSNIEGRMESASEPSIVVARCRASGFTYIKHQMSNRPVEVRFDSDELEHLEGDKYMADELALNRNFNAIFGEKVEIVRLVSMSAQFHFAEEYCKKVPVEGVFDINYSPQYINVADPVLSPDSIFIYGTPQRVDGIESVKIRPVHLSDVRNDVNGITDLEEIAGVRLSEHEASYSIDVSRFVDITVKADVSVHNVPRRVDLFYTPGTVDVTYRCLFPLIKDPVGLVSFYISFDDFRSSVHGECMIRHDELPEGVLDIFINPGYCSCVEY